MLPVLRLLRLPTVFTAAADIFLGYLLTHSSLLPLDQFLRLVGASAGLYLSGMVFNDVFDREEDTRERPNRPIPSGQVSLQFAILLGLCLMAAGTASALSLHPTSAGVAGLLIVAILAYDGWLKRTVFGPLAMGSCRFLNVLLGASAQPWSQLLQGLPLVCAAGLGSYIVGVTWFARTEAVVSRRRELLGALVVINLAWLGLIVGIITIGRNPQSLPQWVALIGIAVVALRVNRQARVALIDPSPQAVQRGVKTMLLALVQFDALLILFKTEDWRLALGAALLIVPARLLARVIPMT